MIKNKYYAKTGLLIPQITKIFILYPGKALLYLKNFEDIFPKQVYKGTDDIYCSSGEHYESRFQRDGEGRKMGKALL